jgi:hypothetical protein
MKRPRSVTLIGAALLLHGLGLTAFGGTLIGLILAQQFGWLTPDYAAQVATLQLPSLLVLVSITVQGIFGIVSSIGLLRMRPWAWLMAMIVQGISMILYLADYVRGSPNYVGMAFAVFVVFYLNQRDIQRIFDVARPGSADPPHSVEPPPGEGTSAPGEAVSDMTHLKHSAGD